MEHINLTMVSGPAYARAHEAPSFNYSAAHPAGNFSTYLNLPGGVKYLPGLPGGNRSGVENSTYYMLELGAYIPCMYNDSVGCNLTVMDNISTQDPNITGHAVQAYTLWQLIVLAILAGGTSLITILGNLIVILSFILERTIRQPTNYFIASLAMSDLLIGIVSMPFYTVYLLTGKYWPLGEVLCDLWLALDYTVCLTSIYTVFCITIDRFCSVKIPAKYRSWRTDKKVNIIIAFTWIIPIMVFFTSIFGWQYFVGYRSVPEGMCYVQYMEDALFNCILQIGYFWVTLTVMCVLYTGIYKVALDLQKKSNAKQKKMTSLVSMAGQTMTKIGIGMSKQHQLDSNALFKAPKSNKNDTSTSKKKERKNNGTVNSKPRKQKSTSFGSENNNQDDEKSSSVGFPSDTDPSSQSPKRSTAPRPDDKNPPPVPQIPLAASTLHVPGQPPPVPIRNSSNPPPYVASNIAEAFPPPPPPLPQNNIGPTGGIGRCSPPPPLEGSGEMASNTGNSTLQQEDDVFTYPDGTMDTLPPPPSYSDCVATPSNSSYSEVSGDTSKTHTHNTALAINSPPEYISGVQYIDQDSLKSPLSNENFAFLEDSGAAMAEGKSTTVVIQEPESPVWKKRSSFLEREMREAQRQHERDKQQSRHGKHKDHHHHHKGKHKKEKKQKSAPQDCQTKSKTSVQNNSGSGSASVATSSQGESLSSRFPVTSVTLNTKEGNKAVTKLSKPDEIQPLNADDGTSSQGGGSARKKNRKPGSPLRGIVKSISARRSKRNKSKKVKQKSKSENRARKALRTITIILGAFVICWTPWHILSMIIGFCPTATCVADVLYDISYWLCYLNSPINPLCYAFANQQFKKTFIRIMKFDWHKT